MATNLGQMQNSTSNLTADGNQANQLKRNRNAYEDDRQMHIQPAVQSRIFYTRVKDVGSKLKQEEQRDVRNKKIIEIAKPLPDGNRLSGRTIYWFVTAEEVQFSREDAELFQWKEKIAVSDEAGTIYYLNQVDFVKNKNGWIKFIFPNGETEDVVCYSKQKPPSSKKQKISTSETNSMPIYDESQSAVQGSAVGTPNYDLQGNNTNQHAQGTPSQPLSTSNGNNLILGSALIVNTLLLVPREKPEFVQMIEQTLVELDFEKEASSANQSLFSKSLNNSTRHVLVYSYAVPTATTSPKMSSLYIINDYVPQASEVILLLENEAEQMENFMVVSRINSIPNIDNEASDSWTLTRKTTSFKSVELEYSTLNQPVRLVLAVGELQKVPVLGSASWRNSFGANQLAQSFNLFFLEWTLSLVQRHSVQNIYLCFKSKTGDKVTALTSYAASALKALGIKYDPEEVVVVYGSVLVYLRCPSYITWHILQRKDHIFEELRKDGLIEIYEAFLSDVKESMQRPENKEFLDELTHLQEQMISDNIPEQPTPNRFRVVDSMNLALPSITRLSNTINAAVPELSNDLDVVINEVDGMSISEAEQVSISQFSLIEYPTVEKLPPPVPADKLKVLKKKHAELKKFDNKWTKTVEECYDSDKLRQQLFNFKTDKNLNKIAVRLFLASASAGLATNVAKLMRPFNDKSIVDGVHAGLQIGNTIVEWNQSGLVHIGEFRHTTATAVLLDVQDSVKFDFNEDVAQRMINFIQQWNVERQYSTEEFNSHRFVRDFLQDTMNISLLDRFKGPLGSYMDYVMRTGDVTPRLFSSKHGMMVFKTHKELEDADLTMLRSKLSEDEIKLLKIFHRGFQLQEAANGQDVSNCCYGLPTNGLEIVNDSGKPSNH